MPAAMRCGTKPPVDYRPHSRRIRQDPGTINTFSRLSRSTRITVPVWPTNPTVQALRLMPRSLSFVLLISSYRTITRFEVFVDSMRSQCKASSEARLMFPSQSRFNSHWRVVITECRAVRVRAFCSPVIRPCARATNDSILDSDGNSGPHPIYRTD